MAQIDFLGDPIFQAVDTNGVPIAGGLVWCYAAGTDTLQDMYSTITDAGNKSNPIDNPITLDSTGSYSIVYAGPSKFVLEGSDIDPDTGHGPVIWTADNIGQFGNSIIDPNGNIIVDYKYQASAVNYIGISNAPAGSDPIIQSLGADTNIGVTMKFQGSTKTLTIENDTASYELPTNEGGTGDVMTNNGDGTSSWAAIPAITGILPSGMMMPFAGTTAPSGWLPCDGSAVSRATYSSLFAAIGTTWGVGDGVNTFNVPNSARRSFIGSGGTAGSVGNAVGNTGGVELVALSGSQNGAHTHSATSATSGVHNHVFGIGTVAAAGSGVNAIGSASNEFVSTDPGHVHAITVNTSGNGTPHENMPPVAVALYVIKV